MWGITGGFSQWSRCWCLYDRMVRCRSCHDRWTCVGYTCWYPLTKMVDMPVLNHTRLPLHLIGHGSSLVHDCTGPPLWLILAITNHYFVTHCSSCSGEPNAENTRLRVAMVLTAVVEVISKISGHLEWASTSNINIFHRRDQQSLCGLAAKEIQATATGAMVSGWMHSSLPCRKYMPWQVPLCLHPFQATTSHDFSSVATVAGQPLSVNCITRLTKGSCHEHSFSLAAVTGRAWTWSR